MSLKLRVAHDVITQYMSLKDLHATIMQSAAKYSMSGFLLQEAEVLNGRIAMVAFALLVGNSAPCEGCHLTIEQAPNS